MNAAVIGAGAWGTALACQLSRNGHDTVLWFRSPEKAALAQETRVNPRLKNAVLPPQLLCTADPQCVRGCELVVIAAPSFPIRSVCQTVAPYGFTDRTIRGLLKALESGGYIHTEVRLDVSIRRVKDLRLTYNLIPGGGADADNTTVQLSAETIRVSGSEAALENLGDTLSIGTINLADITKNTSVTFGISLPDGITNLTGVTEVTADISFHGLSIKELTVTDIQSINIPEGLSVELITEKLTVTLRGPTGLISKVTPEDLLVTVDFTGAEVGTSTFRATVSLSGEYSALGTVKTEPVSAKIDAE